MHQRANHAVQCCIQDAESQNERGSHFQQGEEKAELVQLVQEQKKVLRMKRETKRKEKPREPGLGLWGQQACWTCTDCLLR